MLLASTALFAMAGPVAASMQTGCAAITAALVAASLGRVNRTFNPQGKHVVTL